MIFILLENNFELLPEKAMFNASSKTLIVSDLHLGKATHFRKAGISIPAASSSSDYQRLRSLLEIKQPKRIYIIGDLFHSSINSEWQQLERLVEDNIDISFTLILGNHDILSPKTYEQIGIKVITGNLIEDNIIYSHEPLEIIPHGYLNIAGHIHPGVSLRGKGNQYLRLPCFYYHEGLLLLPAFGYLTGLHTMPSHTGAKFFAITSSSVIEI